MGVIVQLPARSSRPQPGSCERFLLSRRLAIEYRSGASIRGIAAGHGLSYYYTRQLLIETDTTFRTTTRPATLRLVQ